MSTAGASTPAVSDEDAMGAALQEIQQARASGEPAPADAVATAPAEPPAVVDPGAPATPPAPAADAPAPAAETKTPEQLLADAQREIHRLRSDEGRVSALNRKATEAARENADLRKQLDAARKPPATEAEALGQLAALSEQVKDFPELKSIVDTVGAALKEVENKARSHATAAAQEAMRPLEPLRQQHEAQQNETQEAAVAADLKTFSDTYPQAREVLASDDFKNWLPKQSLDIRRAYFDGNTPGEALPVMDAYDAHLRRSGKPSIAHFPNTQQPAATDLQANAVKPADNRLARASGIPSRQGNGSKGALPPEDDFDGSLEFFRNKRLAQGRAAAA